MLGCCWIKFSNFIKYLCVCVCVSVYFPFEYYHLTQDCLTEKDQCGYLSGYLVGDLQSTMDFGTEHYGHGVRWSLVQSRAVPAINHMCPLD